MNNRPSKENTMTTKPQFNVWLFNSMQRTTPPINSLAPLCVRFDTAQDAYSAARYLRRLIPSRDVWITCGHNTAGLLGTF